MQLEKWHKVALFIAFIVTATLGIEARYASSGFVKQIDERLEQKILSDRRANLQERVWNLDDRFGPGCLECDLIVKDEYRRLLFEIKEIDEQLSPEGSHNGP